MLEKCCREQHLTRFNFPCLLSKSLKRACSPDRWWVLDRQLCKTEKHLWQLCFANFLFVRRVLAANRAEQRCRQREQRCFFPFVLDDLGAEKKIPHPLPIRKMPESVLLLDGPEFQAATRLLHLPPALTPNSWDLRNAIGIY
ncbi:hypothetical protein CDAR_78941 [Caerostris darwini]|uniref:Uncharacterized protein n=1 Tax=Caerostris darwini TaxID=1538125 RepID=A0AAV4Q1Y1_9ARAC|nr:hypothetical protein CDAR_78941 [Caerostris darwini]